jgi:hypothetical protein
MDTAHMAIALGNNHWSQRHHANAVIHPVTGKEMEYSALMKDPRLQPLWTRGFGNECGRLFQGIRDIPGTDTCLFIELKNIPNERKITYGKIVCDYKPHKQEKECVRLTVVGDIIDYSGDVATSTADITTFKILINSTLSTEDAAMMMMDIKNYYLGTPLPRFEYMKMLLSRFPEEIIQKYNLNALAVGGWVYIEIRKGMYGLKQAGLLANQLLQTRLAPFGYSPPGTPRDYGYTRLGQSLSRSWSTISQLNTSASNMQSISGTPFYERMNSQLTGRQRCTPA